MEPWIMPTLFITCGILAVLAFTMLMMFVSTQLASDAWDQDPCVVASEPDGEASPHRLGPGSS